MKIKYQYRYQEFENYPEATEISKQREEQKARRKALSPFLYILYPILIIGVLSGSYQLGLLWLAIPLLILIIYAIVYFTKNYDKITEKKIKEAILRADLLKQEVANDKYKCKKIKFLSNVKDSKCMICFKRTSNSKYRIKNDIGTRDIPICDECLKKIKSNNLIIE